ncbi:hypothetical protein AC579_10215 [Pseudocercospora musae]|uniref:Uncharacterized protein n=1 Tax=Pseudocercospora musae TaxID=113226 RepID=A0A139HM91_9PEZI|nr:hypothetical protein AC579_10215 [Pseudocercospora musae]
MSSLISQDIASSSPGSKLESPTTLVSVTETLGSGTTSGPASTKSGTTIPGPPVSVSITSAVETSGNATSSYQLATSSSRNLSSGPGDGPWPSLPITSARLSSITRDEADHSLPTANIAQNISTFNSISSTDFGDLSQTTQTSSDPASFSVGITRISDTIGASGLINIGVPSSSTTQTSQLMTPTAAAASPCPTDFEGACGAPEQTCTSFGGHTYLVTCGIGYLGTTITDDQVTPSSVSADRKLVKRYEADDFAACQEACDATTICIGVTYIPPTNCTLFSVITGTYPLLSAVGAILVSDVPSIASAVSSTTPMVSAPISTSQAVLPTTDDLRSSTSLSSATTSRVGGPTSVSCPTSSACWSLTTESGVPAPITTNISSCTEIGMSELATNTLSLNFSITSEPSNTFQDSSFTTKSTVDNSIDSSVDRPSVASITTPAATCPRVVSGTGYVTVYTTYTYTKTP